MQYRSRIRSNSASRANAQSGFSLLEILISVLLFSIGLLALIGMQAVVVGTTMDSEYRLQASYLTNRVIGRMWVDRANLTTYDTDNSPNAFLADWLADVSTSLPGASGANAPTIQVNGAQVDIVVRWQRPGDGEIRSLRTTTFINGPT